MSSIPILEGELFPNLGFISCVGCKALSFESTGSIALVHGHPSLVMECRNCHDMTYVALDALMKGEITPPPQSPFQGETIEAKIQRIWTKEGK